MQVGNVQAAEGAFPLLGRQTGAMIGRLREATILGKRDEQKLTQGRSSMALMIDDDRQPGQG